MPEESQGAMQTTVVRVDSACEQQCRIWADISYNMLLCISYNTYGMQKNREGEKKKNPYTFLPTIKFKAYFKGG